MKKYQKIEIEWIDSMHSSGWQYVSNIKPVTVKEILHKTVGYFLHKDKLTIAVCQSYKVLPYKDNDMSIDAVLEIPICAVIKIRELKK